MEEQLADYIRVSMQAYLEDYGRGKWEQMLQHANMSSMLTFEIAAMQAEPELYKERYNWDVLEWDMQEHFTGAYIIYKKALPAF